MKRIFSWKDHLVVAESIDDAWKMLQELLLDKPELEGGIHTMDKWVLENCYDIPPGYDEIDSRESLHAVDYAEDIMFSWEDIPSGIVGKLWGTTFQEPNMNDGLDCPVLGRGSLSYVLHGDASDWADILPLGFTFRPEMG